MAGPFFNVIGGKYIDYSLLVDENGNVINAANPLPAALVAGDIEIGAVEIKNGGSDQRATVDTGGNLRVSATAQYTTKTATIANGESLSGEVDLEGYTLCALSMPAAWTAADITFAAATATGGTFNPLLDDAGNEVTSKAAASNVYAQDINMGKLAGVRFIKLRSGTSASAVAQGAERIITLILKG